ncbi:MAG: DUF4339 domain-containing protein [Pirellulales bacterium]
MAHEWYVQHGGKQYGPMSPSNLKKLAADGKITPATQVRIGESGTWVPASKVQGLFVAAAASSSGQRPQSTAPATDSSARPLSPPPPPPVDPLATLPRAVPAPPIVANSMAPPPWARGTASPNASASSSAAAKILGALAMIFAAVAMATCWLPILASPIGWTAIGFGGLGLLIGIAGLVAATMTNSSSGLLLNIIGSGGSAVGLVLAVVLGVTFGLFGGTPEPVVTARPTLPPIVEAPPRVVQPEPQPEPPPEPIWTDASEAIEQGPIEATIASVGIEQVRLESADLSTIGRSKAQPMLKIRVTLQNVSIDRIVEAPGWMGGGDLIGQGVGQLLGGETGKAVQAATATAMLADNAGNNYKQTSTLSLFGAQLDFSADHALRPGNTKTLDLVFPPPLETIEYLRLELSPAGFSGADSLRFQIPKAMISGMVAPAGG